MTEFLARLKQRKLVQWALAYIAFAFALIQVLDVVASRFGWPAPVERSIILALAVGFVVVLVLAWYHGEQGRQRVSGVELLLLALVLAIGGGLLWRFGRPASPPMVVARMVRSHNAAVCRSGPCPRAAAGMQAQSPASLASTPAVAAQPIPAKSVAVLPFENLSGDPGEKYFSDGITVEILHALAQIPDLKVSGRTSAFQFSSKDEDLRKVGETLGVANVLEGSVQKAGDEVRINVQLIDAHTGYQRWSEKYDRKLTNIFAVEDDISSTIAGKLRVQLTGGAGQALVAQKTVDPRAHDFYLRGLNLLAARGPGLRDAVTAFQNAVKIDPRYADAWGALAEAEALLPDYGLGTMQAAYPAALADARHALSLNPDLASAYVAQGMVYKNQWRWPEADQAFRRALALAPNDAEAVDQYAQFLSVTGQQDRALTEIEHAQRLDPLSGIIGVAHGNILTRLHRYNEAEPQYKSVIAAHPDFALGYANAMNLDTLLHRYPDAEKRARLFAGLKGKDADALVLVIRGISDPTLRARALRELETSAAFAGIRRDPVTYANVLVRLGANGRALDVLRRFAVERDSSHLEELWNPALDPIRNDPRFKAALKQMGLPYTPKGAMAP